MGLAIVAEFAASMGAAVHVTDAAMGGARFVVSFPVVGPSETSTTEGVSHVAVP
jgi:signal transduction histidine kinase